MGGTPKFSAKRTYVFDEDELGQLDELSLTSVIREATESLERSPKEPEARTSESEEAASPCWHGDATINELLKQPISSDDPRSNGLGHECSNDVVEGEPAERKDDLIAPELLFPKDSSGNFWVENRMTFKKRLTAGIGEQHEMDHRDKFDPAQTYLLEETASHSLEQLAERAATTIPPVKKWGVQSEEPMLLNISIDGRSEAVTVRRNYTALQVVWHKRDAAPEQFTLFPPKGQSLRHEVERALRERLKD